MSRELLKNMKDKTKYKPKEPRYGFFWLI